MFTFLCSNYLFMFKLFVDVQIICLCSIICLSKSMLAYLVDTCIGESSDVTQTEPVVSGGWDADV